MYVPLSTISQCLINRYPWNRTYMINFTSLFSFFVPPKYVTLLAKLKTVVTVLGTMSLIPIY